MKIFFSLVFVVVVTTSALAQYDDAMFRKQGRFGVSVKAGPAFPVGEFADLFKAGFTGFIDVPYNLTEEFQVYLGLGYSSFNVDNGEVGKELAEQGLNGTANLDAPYHVIPFVLGINYSYRYKGYWPYFTISFGMYFQTLETSGTLTIDGVTTPVTPNSQSWSQGAFAVGIGSLIPLGDEGWAIDVNAKFNSVVDYEGRVLIATSGGNDISTRAIRYVSVLGGLSYTFR